MQYKSYINEEEKRNTLIKDSNNNTTCNPNYSVNKKAVEKVFRRMMKNSNSIIEDESKKPNYSKEKNIYKNQKVPMTKTIDSGYIKGERNNSIQDDNYNEYRDNTEAGLKPSEENMSIASGGISSHSSTSMAKIKGLEAIYLNKMKDNSGYKKKLRKSKRVKKEDQEITYNMNDGLPDTQMDIKSRYNDNPEI